MEFDYNIICKHKVINTLVWKHTLVFFWYGSLSTNLIHQLVLYRRSNNTQVLSPRSLTNYSQWVSTKLLTQNNKYKVFVAFDLQLVG